MSEMVERVARAIARRRMIIGLLGDQIASHDPKGDKIDAAFHELWSGTDDLSERQRKRYRGDAIAAIAEMREPTEEMKTCRDEVHWGYSCHICGGLTEGWYAMIDAALK